MSWKAWGLALFTIFLSCSGPGKMEQMDVSSIDSILISYYPDNGIPPLSPRKLSGSAAKGFITDWNDASSDGLCKYIARYTLTVYVTNGIKRHFRANGRHIKEMSDECFLIGEENYFDRLWENSK